MNSYLYTKFEECAETHAHVNRWRDGVGGATKVVGGVG